MQWLVFPLRHDPDGNQLSDGRPPVQTWIPMRSGAPAPPYAGETLARFAIDDRAPVIGMATLRLGNPFRHR